jgi:hypothetical protein
MQHIMQRVLQKVYESNSSTTEPVAAPASGDRKSGEPERGKK